MPGDLIKLSSAGYYAYTSDVTRYDGKTPLTEINGSDMPGLNSLISRIDKAIKNARENPVVSTVASTIVDVSGIPLNTVLGNIATSISSLNGTNIAYVGTGPSNYTPTAATVYGHLRGIDAGLGSVISSVSALSSTVSGKAALADIYNHITGISNGFVVSGLAPTSSGASLNVSYSAGDLYVDGQRFSTIGGSSTTMVAIRDNYVDVNSSGFTVSDVPIGDPAPAVVGLRLFMFTTDATGVTATEDLRVNYPINGDLLEDDSISTRHIGNLQVTSAKMAVTGVTAAAYTFANVTVDVAGRVTAISSAATLTSLADNQLMKYDLASGKFINVNFYGGILPTIADTYLYAYDSGSGSATGVPRDTLFRERWIAYSFNVDDFKPNATNEGYVLILNPVPGSVVEALKIKHFVAFAGGTTSDALVEVFDANTGAGNDYTGGVGFNVFQAVGDAVGKVWIPNSMPILDHVNNSALYLRLTIAGDIIDNLTDGEVIVWVKTTQVTS